MDVIINDKAIDVPVEISTWGDLLDWVESDYLAAGQCITHVYLDGKESLNYRNTAICNQEITNVSPVAIRSGDFDSVISDSLAELSQELKSSFASVTQIIRLFDDRKENEAYDRLGQLLDSIGMFLEIFSEDLGWAEARYTLISRTEISSTLERTLTRLVAAKENRYSLYIREVLEYEIAPIIESLQRLVERTCEHIG